MAIQIADMRTAIHNWVVLGSGLPPNKVIWVNQNGTRPSGSYITIKLEIRGVGHDWARIKGDPDPANDSIYVVEGNRKLIIEIQAFGQNALDSTILDKVALARTIPNISESLCLAGVGIYNFSDIQDLSATIRSSKIDTRTRIVASGHITTSIEIPAISIKTVQAHNNNNNQDLVIN